jgi:hypothetical protein
MPIIVFVYKCVNKSCGYVKKLASLERSQLICPKCHTNMEFVGIEINEA